MALITRCPVCGTLFKVVPDQLRISEGWVRCGHCAEVFDASHDLQQSAAEHQSVLNVEMLVAPGPPEAPAFALEFPDPAFPSEPLADADVLLDSASDFMSLDVSEPLVDDPMAVLEIPPDSVPAILSPDPASGEDAEMVALPEDEPVDAVVLEPEPGPPQEEGPAESYSFIREAAVPAAASRPAARWLGGGAVAGALLAGLCLQGVVHARDRLAAHWPETKPGLQALCGWLGCTVDALRQIESIVIDSSTLSTLQNGDAYRLSLVLKNQAQIDLAMPDVEFVLTDIDEQAVFKRVLSPAELGAASRMLYAGREWTTSVDLRIADVAGKGRVVGYRLLAFYP